MTSVESETRKAGMDIAPVINGEFVFYPEEGMENNLISSSRIKLHLIDDHGKVTPCGYGYLVRFRSYNEDGDYQEMSEIIGGDYPSLDIRGLGRFSICREKTNPDGSTSV